MKYKYLKFSEVVELRETELHRTIMDKKLSVKEITMDVLHIFPQTHFIITFTIFRKIILKEKQPKKVFFFPQNKSHTLLSS
jgi:hypothetical protein